MTPPKLLWPPLSLQYLQSLSDYTIVTCVGRSWPTGQPCNQRLDIDDMVLHHAVGKLQNLSKSELKNHGIGLISALKSIALPYYWIALDSMPEFLSCMGLDGPITKSCSPKEKASIQDAVNRLAPDELWYVHRAMGHMNSNNKDQWWSMDKNGVTAKFFRDMLEEKVAIDGNDEIKRREQLLAAAKWEIWHQFLDADNDDYEDEGSQDDTWQSNESENDPVSSAALSDSQDATISNRQQLRENGPATPNERLSFAEPQLPTAPSPAPEAMQTTASRGQSFQTPPRQQRRPSRGPSLSPNSTSYNQNAQIAPLRRRSAPQNTLKRPEVLQTQCRQVLSDDSRSLGGQHVAHNNTKLQRSSLSSSEIKATNYDSHATTTQPLADIPRLPEFHQFKEPTSGIHVTRNVFKEMRQALTYMTTKDRGDKDEGYIYALRMPKCPRYIKIGRTKDDIRRRKKRIEVCAGAELELFNPGDNCSVIYHEKVEKLVHLALHPFRRKFECIDCKVNGKRHQDGGPVEHGEWFQIDEDQAIDTISRWRHWMNSNPYRDYQLKATEVDRINVHDKRLAKTLNTDGKGKDLESFDWDTFMRFTTWQLFQMQFNNYFLEDRPHRNDSSSRRDSLLKYWHFNLISFSFFFASSSIMSAFVRYIPLPLNFFVVFASVFSSLLGVLAVLYAA